MPAPISISFQAEGVANVQKAFQTIEQASLRFQRAQERSEGQAVVRARRQAGQQADAHVRAHEAAMKKQERATAAAEKAKLQLQLNSARMASRLLDQEAKANERAEQQKTRIAEREAAKRTQIYAREARQARIAIDRESKSGADKRERFIGGVAGRASRSVGNALGTAATMAGGLLAVGGGFGVADSVSTEMANRGRAADLALQSGGKVSKDELYRRSASAATQFGMSTEETLQMLDAFVAKSGDVSGGLSNLDSMMALKTATGANSEELGRAAGQIFMGGGDMSVVRMLAEQGRAGSVDMRELAQYAARIGGGSAMFAGSKAGNMKVLGAIVQQAAATGGASSSAEATESIARLGTDVFEHEDKFRALGITTRDKSGKFLAGPREIIEGAIRKTGGDEGKLLDLFGKQSFKAVAGFSDIYKRAGGGAAGDKAMDEAFAKFMQVTLNEERVRQEAVERMQENDKKFAAALNDLRTKVGGVLLPELTKLIPKITELTPKFVELLRGIVDIVSYFANNPFTGLGALVSAFVVKELASAGIGSLVASLLRGASAGGIGGGVGALGAAGGIAAVAAGVGIAGKLAIDASLGSASSARSASIAADIGNANDATAAIRGGDILEQKSAAIKLSGEIARMKASRGDSGFVENAVGMLPFSGVQDAKKARESAQDRTIAQAEAKLAELTAAIEKATVAFNSMSGPAAKAAPGAAERASSMADPTRGPVGG